MENNVLIAKEIQEGLVRAKLDLHLSRFVHVHGEGRNPVYCQVVTGM